MMQINYNPDVLTCLANLSNDEVFTPPSLANDILDLLPADIWSNPDAKFLDPVSKSGIFLREMAKRLVVGLEQKIPDKQERINHILKNQLYGIAITELTALLSRRSVYCSKTANSEYSVCDQFDDEQGNVIYKSIQHTWKDGKCTYCGASKDVYHRDKALETYAYNFIHTDKPEKLFNMKFDVIVGNPPYQLNDGGGTGSSAKPIYNLFIEQAKKLKPRYLTMIVPARWYSGGKGLDNFRDEMLQDHRISVLVDYVDSRDCFPGVDIAGGVCYFLWEKDRNGICDVTTVRKNTIIKDQRFLGEFDTFIRDNVSIGIIRKIKSQHSSFLDRVVSSRMPFGLPSNQNFESDGDLVLISSSGTGNISKKKITSNVELIDKWKVLLSKASNDHGGQPDKDGKRRIFSKIEVMPPGTVCTESYLAVGKYESELEASNMVTYLQTSFCRFLVPTILLTQNITKGKFAFVPDLDMTETWSNDRLFDLFNINEQERDFIFQTIRPM